MLRLGCTFLNQTGELEEHQGRRGELSVEGDLKGQRCTESVGVQKPCSVACLLQKCYAGPRKSEGRLQRVKN